MWGSKGGDDTLHVDVGLLLSIRLHDKGVVDKDTYWACFTMDSTSQVCVLSLFHHGLDFAGVRLAFPLLTANEPSPTGSIVHISLMELR